MLSRHTPSIQHVLKADAGSVECITKSADNQLLTCVFYQLTVSLGDFVAVLICSS